ncbi:MAG: ABC transporter substrate-binding protein [Deltaproteobacteria bacterium]|nr:ABC transporter substrate-binding protein [Deltaproteobacteria bacterium]MBW2009367.1 ABC transporter substrate-binding protein [Deltaproteobacteria bacterium]MBW2101699.1 ABC transporter substrate-binding protein [Deltaproteobacteria bacterium]
MTEKKIGRREFLKSAGAAGIGLGAAGALGSVIPVRKAKASQTRSIPKTPIKVAAISFLSGAAAAPFGIPGDNAYKLCADKINSEGGIMGRKIEMKSFDEAGGADAQVKLARKLILEDKVDVILGYISSGNCKAVLPLSDELGGLIIAYDCGTHVLMEKRRSPYKVPKYGLGFRSSAHLGIDNIGLARYIKHYYPDVRKVAGINPDYAWGRDSWSIFEKAIKKLIPGVQVVKKLWPKLFTTDYTAHISALIGSGAEIIHSALWGGDAVTFTKQAIGMGLFKRARMAYSRGEPYPQEVGMDYPEGQIICCAGTHYFLYPPKDKWPLNKWFVEEFHKRYNKYPSYPCYHAYQAIFTYKAAVEKAGALTGGWPSKEEISMAASGLSIETPSGILTIGTDHNGREDVLVGISKKIKGYPFPILDPDRMAIFPAHQVNAPAGIRTADWIDGWKA